jgi:hypothetical protein
MNFYIHISQLAILTGDNPYQSKKDYLLDFWKKNHPEDYCMYTERLKEKDMIPEKDIEIIEKIAKKYKATIKYEENPKVENVKELEMQKKEILQNMEQVITNEEDKKKMMKAVTNLTNTQFGTHNEMDVTKLYEEKMGYSIVKDDIYRKRLIYEKKDEEDQILYRVYIGGKIDGIEPESHTIIEIKNRVRSLFYKLRDYEKTQLYGYMHLHHATRSHLVEALRTKKGTKINIIEVEKEDVYMEEVLRKTIHFIEFYNTFIHSESMKCKLIEGIWPIE